MNKPKFSTTLIVLIGLLLVLPLFASAAPSITESTVKITADYSKFTDDDDDFIVISTQSFTVVNDGNTAITVKATGLPSGYNSPSKTVEANSTSAITLTVEVPHSKSPGEEKIGSIVLTDSNNQQLDSADLIQETNSMLDLTELEVKYTDADGKTIRDEFASDDLNYALENEVKPYTEMTFTFDLQNLFDRDYNNKGELEEIELNLDLDNSDLLKEDFQDSYPIENIEAGKGSKFSVTLPISEEVEADTYTIEFTITAEDSEGIEYEIKKELQIEIQLEDDDIRIVSAKLVPETATVCDSEINLEVKVHNFGSDDQDKVAVTLLNTELGLNQKIENIAIDSHTEDDDSWQKTFIIPLKNTKAKAYFLDLKTLINNKITDAEIVQLNLKACTLPPKEKTETTAVEEEEEQTKALPVKPEPQAAEKTTDNQGTAGNVVKSIEKISYDHNDYLVALMLIAIAVVAAMIVLMIVILFK